MVQVNPWSMSHSPQTTLANRKIGSSAKKGLNTRDIWPLENFTARWSYRGRGSSITSIGSASCFLSNSSCLGAWCAAMAAIVPATLGAAGPALDNVLYKHSACALEEGRCLATRAASAESEQSLSFAPPGCLGQVEVVVQKDAGPAAAAKEVPAAGADQHRSLVYWVPKRKTAQVLCQCRSLQVLACLPAISAANTRHALPEPKGTALLDAGPVQLRSCHPPG